MKRSEMVDVIEMAINLNRSKDVKGLADYILKTMEGFGILPPVIEQVVMTPEYEGDEDSWIGNQDEYTIVSALQWEPEND